VRAKDVWQRVRWVLALTLLCALATCPAAQRRCANRRAAREAPALLAYLVTQLKSHVAEHHALPDLTIPATPPIGTCCTPGPACTASPALWRTPAWRSLHFSIDGPHRFSYAVHRDLDALVLTATGDQDCDSVRAIYQVRLTLDHDRLVEVWTETNPYE
jgi:hypothetical protein